LEFRIKKKRKEKKRKNENEIHCHFSFWTNQRIIPMNYLLLLMTLPRTLKGWTSMKKKIRFPFFSSADLATPSSSSSSTLKHRDPFTCQVRHYLHPMYNGASHSNMERSMFKVYF